MESIPRAITLVTSSMDAGGAERVASIMANYWVRNNCRISIVMLAGDANVPFYRLHPEIRVISLDLLSISPNFAFAIVWNLRRVWEIRRAIARTEPDFVISFVSETNILTIFAMMRSGVPTIVTEHTDPESWPLPPVWSWLRKFTYRLSTQVVVLNEYIQKFFWTNLRQSTVVIPNPVSTPEKLSDNASVTHKQIVAVGRFSVEKRFDVLLRAFGTISDQHKDWKLVVIGDGQLWSEIKQLAKSLNVNDRVILPGYMENTQAMLRASEIFVSTSVVEGFPMAICEAMACGLAVVAVEYNAGVKEIIDNEVSGLLVPPDDIQAVAAAIDRLICDSATRKRLGAKARVIVSMYNTDDVMLRWNQLLDGLGKA